MVWQQFIWLTFASEELGQRTRASERGKELLFLVTRVLGLIQLVQCISYVCGIALFGNWYTSNVHSTHHGDSQLSSGTSNI